MPDPTKTITHELISDAGGKVSLDVDKFRVAAGLPAGTLIPRVRTTIVLEKDYVIEVAQAAAPPVYTVSPINRILIVDGDSRPAAGQNVSQTANQDLRQVLISGYEFWMQAAAGNVFTLGENYALGGDDTQKWLDNQAAALASGAGFYSNLIGVNDGTIALEQTKANFLTGIDRAIAAGMCVQVATDLPWTSVTGGPTGPGAIEHLAYVAWLQSGAPLVGRENKAVLTDTFTCALKPGTVIDYKDGWAPFDGLHPYLLGHRNIGTFMAGSLANVVWPGAHPAPLPTVAAGTINSNPMMTGTTGAKGSGVDAGAVVATGWRLDQFNTTGAVVTGSKDVDADGYAQQRVTITGTPTGANPSVTLYQASTISSGVSLTGLTAGTRVRAVAKIKLFDPPSASRIYAVSPQIRLVGTKDGVSYSVTRRTGAPVTSRGWLETGYDFAAGIMTQDIVVPAGMTVTSAFFEIIINGGQNLPMDCVVGVSRAAWRIVT